MELLLRLGNTNGVGKSKRKNGNAKMKKKWPTGAASATPTDILNVSIAMMMFFASDVSRYNLRKYSAWNISK